MKYLTDEIWNKLPILDFRSRFFIETYIEKLSMDTPHFAQSRLMNVFSCCIETLIYIDEYQANDKNGGYIHNSLDEIENCFKNDPIAKSLFLHMEDIITQLFKQIRGGDLGPNKLNHLSVICRAILSCEEKYSEILLERIKTSIFDATNLSHMDRITTEIYTLTSLYTTCLLNKGYSPTYLFNRHELFTRTNNYSGKSFQQQFDIISKKLKSNSTTYDVYFAIHANKAKSLLSIDNDLDFTFMKELPSTIKGSDSEKIKKDLIPNVIAKTTIKATDYISAAWQTKDKLDKLLDSVTALELNPKINVSAHCITTTKNNRTIHTKTLNINLLIGFLVSEGGTYFSHINTSIRNSFSTLDEEGRDHLGRSLRYLRLARESVSLEQKLLNLWIALESLFSDRNSNILSNILDYVPQIYAIFGINRRIHYLKNLLVAGKAPIIEELQKELNISATEFNKEITDEQTFYLLRNEKIAKDTFNSIKEKEHLKYKLIKTFEELKDNSALRKRIELTESDVKRQLRRIYFLRNKITHTGHYANIRPQLITHLLDYLAVCYLAISKSSEKSILKNNYSLSDLLASYKMGVDVVIIRLSSKSEIANQNELIPSPII